MQLTRRFRRFSAALVVALAYLIVGVVVGDVEIGLMLCLAGLVTALLLLRPSKGVGDRQS
jgi:hypothetical protein